MMMMMMLLLSILLITTTTTTNAFYLPGIKPHSYLKDEIVELKVNAMTSIHTQMPKDYYSLPFCRPSNGIQMANENLGEFLTGNKIESSPYLIHTLHDSYCQILCQVNALDRMEARKLQIHVKFGYHNNWIIDNLPSAVVVNGASVAGTDKKQRHYAGGFPIGYVLPKAGVDTTGRFGGGSLAVDEASVGRKKYSVTRKFWELEDCYIYNHVNLHIDYHVHDSDVIADESGKPKEGYRVVGFAIEPMSIRHIFLNEYQWDGRSSEGYLKPLTTCPGVSKRKHLTRADITDPQMIKEGETILFTYDVIWNKSNVEWASRWDVYLSEDNMIPAQVHWYSINNSLLVVLSLSVLVASILVRNLRRDIAGYNSVSTLTDEERDEEIEEKGWKLVHADVFRPPSVRPMMFSIFVGSGIQIVLTILCSIVFSAVGFLSPARRGSLLLAILICFIIFGIANGYVSARLYKCFKGRKWQTCTLCASLLFPGLCFTIFLVFNIILYFFHSVGSVPFLDVLILGAMWCCVSIPLVFLGAYVGYKMKIVDFPTKTSTIARVIPDSGTYLMKPMVSMLLAGLMPFSAAFVELFFIMTSLWMDQFYYVFGFTFIVFIIILITCSEVAILLCYYQLCAENHRWYWFSFVTAGSTGFYLFAYSCFWFRQLEASKMFITYMLYFGYMFIISAATFLATGSIGFLSCFWFTRKIFASIKVD